jgi:thiamine biosynthesis lipoprotein
MWEKPYKIKIYLITQLVLYSTIISGCFTGCSPLGKPLKSLPGLLYRYEFSQPQMGTLFRIVLYAPSDSIAQHAAQSAFKRVDELNVILSDYLETSELSKLSATAGTGQAFFVSKDLWIVLEKSMEAAKQSNGAFDITVGPYVSLWRRARRQQILPAPDALVKARQKVGYQHIKLDPVKHTAQLLVPEMKLDLGGIGKGYAADEAFAILKKYGITTALVDAGGNMVVGDAPPGKKGWDIEVASLVTNNKDTTQVITLTHAAVATSGDMFQFVEIDGKKYSHIVDPRTGIGLTGQIMVTVLAPDGTMADYLSTAVSVLGPKEGLILIEKTKKSAALILRNTDSGIKKWESRKWKFLSKGQ